MRELRTATRHERRGGTLVDEPAVTAQQRASFDAAARRQLTTADAPPIAAQSSKTFLVPRDAAGGFGTPIPLYELGPAGVTPTAAFVALAATDVGACRLLAGFQLALGDALARDGGYRTQRHIDEDDDDPDAPTQTEIVPESELRGSDRKDDYVLRGLAYWLTGADARETYVVLDQALDDAGHHNTAATTIYDARPTAVGRADLDWAAYGGAIAAPTAAAYRRNYFRAGMAGKNLLIFDPDDLADPMETAIAVFHEFFVHLSIPLEEERRRTGNPQARHWQWQHDLASPASPDSWGLDATIRARMERAAEK